MVEVNGGCRSTTTNLVVMRQYGQNKPGQKEQGFHQTIYKINGKLLNYAIKVWVGLMIGITLMETFAPAEHLDAWIC